MPILLRTAAENAYYMRLCLSLLHLSMLCVQLRLYLPALTFLEVVLSLLRVTWSPSRTWASGVRRVREWNFDAFSDAGCSVDLTCANLHECISEHPQSTALCTQVEWFGSSCMATALSMICISSCLWSSLGVVNGSEQLSGDACMHVSKYEYMRMRWQSARS